MTGFGTGLTSLTSRLGAVTLPLAGSGLLDAGVTFFAVGFLLSVGSDFGSELFDASALAGFFVTPDFTAFLAAGFSALEAATESLGFSTAGSDFSNASGSLFSAFGTASSSTCGKLSGGLAASCLSDPVSGGGACGGGASLS